ncbi:fimbrial protein [Dyella sp. GSA-30]|uniref:fimbrial protein n=1 Tax=Dyella sp. GSA-30 TaxID=2994496 RepID=UPI00248FFB72|nr:fimbrial protein [Dyella sp. GSA-30]BDU18633.1 ferrous iron transporter B [Dyella sp. GSA-30]
MMRKCLMLSGIAVLAAHAGTACAQAQFDIHGTIEPGTCEWVVGDDDKKVLFDPINVTAFPAAGGAGFKTFALGLRNCTAGLTRARFVFSGASDANDAIRFANSGTAAGVAVELQAADGSTIAADGSNSSRTVPVTAGSAVIQLRAGYWRIGTRPLTSGTVSSVALVSVSYN